MSVIELRTRILVHFFISSIVINNIRAFIHAQRHPVKVNGDFGCFAWKPQQKHVVHFPKSENQSRKDWARNMDEYFMGLALDQAQKAASIQEVPIGAVLVRPDFHPRTSGLPTAYEILSVSHNQVERGMDAIAHAEILCLRSAARKLSNWRLVNTTLYTTLEPCVTCMAAAYAFRVDRIVYGARDFRLGAHVSWIEWDAIMPQKHPYHPNGRIAILGGIREEECGLLLKKFFRDRRTEEANRRQDTNRDMNEATTRVPSSSSAKAGSWFSKVKKKLRQLLERIVSR